LGLIPMAVESAGNRWMSHRNRDLNKIPSGAGSNGVLGMRQIVTQRKEATKRDPVRRVSKAKPWRHPIMFVIRTGWPDRKLIGRWRRRIAFSSISRNQAKIRDPNWHCGVRASARETIGLVAAAAVARKGVGTGDSGIEVIAYVLRYTIDRSRYRTRKMR